MRGNVEMGIRYVMPTDKAVVDLSGHVYEGH